MTPHRFFLAMASTIAGAKVESLADLLRAFSSLSFTVTVMTTGTGLPFGSAGLFLARGGLTVR